MAIDSKSVNPNRIDKGDATCCAVVTIKCLV